MSAEFTLVLPKDFKDRLFAHLFPGDRDEHGAVIAAGLARSSRGLRLLARDLFLALDGVDYVPGQRGYRMLTGQFVTEKIRFCRDQSLCYLAVHNHGGGDRVAFSADDLASHDRGYPALLDINRGFPVGALVFATEAAAGDLWLTKEVRLSLGHAQVLGPAIRQLHAEPPPRPWGAGKMFDRQARLLGDAGQTILAQLKVGIIGAGGVGSLLTEYLARLGVGHILVVDPDRLDITNVPRVVGSTRWDARSWFTDSKRPKWIQQIGLRIAARKVDIMHRVARQANRGICLEPIFGDFTEEAVARRFTDCDYLFLAADSFQARLVFNAIVYQYLIPGVQVGVKVPVEVSTGIVKEVFSTSRPVGVTSGCLLCNGLIPPGRLQEEAATPAERRSQRYVAEEAVVAPSVITLNATAASHAVNDFLFAVTGLTRDDAPRDYIQFLPQTRKVRFEETRRDSSCPECGTTPESRRARGDTVPLPTRE